MADLKGTSLPKIAAKAGVHRSFVYRVAAGEKTSARVEQIIARELGIKIHVLRSMK